MSILALAIGASWEFLVGLAIGTLLFHTLAHVHRARQLRHRKALQDAEHRGRTEGRT